MFGEQKPKEQKSNRPFSTAAILVPAGKKKCPQAGCDNGKASMGFACTHCSGKGFI